MYLKINPRNFNVNKELMKKCLEVAPATIGHHLQYEAGMDSEIKPLYRGVKIAGPAITVRCPIPLDTAAVHYALKIAKPGDVIVIDRGGDKQQAAVGEMVALCAKHVGVAGIVVDGAATDIIEIEEMKMPVFTRRLSASCGRLLGMSGEINTIINCGGVIVRPGDIVFADDNGVLVIPPDDLEELIEKARKSEEREIGLRKKMAEGELLCDLGRASGIIEKALKEKQ